MSSFLCGYRKGFNPQHALISPLEKWRMSLYKEGYGGAILLDLSKAFDTLNHDLLVTKLNAYGFDMNALLLINSYLADWWQRIKINSSFSSWTELLSGVLQGYVLGPLLFNIYVNDLFYLIESSDVCNYADDTTLYTCNLSLDSLMSKLENSAQKALDWFGYNYMKLNSDTCHILVCGTKHETMIGSIGNCKISNIKLRAGYPLTVLVGFVKITFQTWGVFSCIYVILYHLRCYDYHFLV